MFAALALVFSAIAVLGAGPASAVDDSNCVLVREGVHACYSITTQVASHIPLGNAVQDTATVTAVCQFDETQPVVEPNPTPIVCPPTPDGLQPQVLDSTTTVTFQIFQGCDGTKPMGSQVGSDDVQDITVPVPGSASVDSSPVSGLAAGNYSYVATFSNDVTVVGDCEPFTVDPATPVVNTVINTDSTSANGPVVHDSATVSAVTGFALTGEVSFTFYNNSTCSPSGSSVSTDDVVDGAATSTSVGPLAAGSYSFLAHFDPEGNTNYLAADGPCESLVVNTTTTTVTQTVLQPQPVLQPVIVVQPAAPQQVVQVSPASAVRTTGTFTG